MTWQNPKSFYARVDPTIIFIPVLDSDVSSSFKIYQISEHSNSIDTPHDNLG